MNHRCKEDEVLNWIRSIAGPARPDDLSQVAFDWLHDILRSEFATEPDFSHVSPRGAESAVATESVSYSGRDEQPVSQPDDPFGVAARFARGEIADALWYREWHRQWRAFQLPDQLFAFAEELGRARTDTDVYNALTEHAVRIVGGYTALLFPPQGKADRLHPVPNPRLRFDTGDIFLPPSPPLPRASSIAAADAARAGSPFARLAPLFSEVRAASLAHAPVGEGGVIFVIERRRERVFEPEDWELLRSLAAQAEAALERVRLFERVVRLVATDPLTGLPCRERLEAVLDHAWAAALRGEGLALVALAVESTDGEGYAEEGTSRDSFLRGVAETLRQEIRPHGLAVRYEDGCFLLVLPRVDALGADDLISRIRLRLSGREILRAGVAEHGPEIRSARELVSTAVGALAQTSPVTPIC